MTTTTSADVLANGIIPLATIQRRRGKWIQSGSNGVIVYAPSYYKVNAQVTFTGASADDAVIELQKNGVAIPGFTSSTTITTADTEVRTLTISGIIRVFPNDGVANLTLVNTGIGITTSNVALSVELLD